MKTVKDAAIIKRDLPDILFDESRFETGVPSLVAFPEDNDELQSIIAEAVKNGKRITFIGAQTGTTGGAAPEDDTWAISFSAMNRIHRILWENDDEPVLLCDPGITLEAIGRFLEDPPAWPYRVSGMEKLIPGAWCYSPDPTEMTAQLGGTVATNASGARSYRFGATRTHIASLELILANGENVVIERKNERSGNWDRKLVTAAGTELTIPELSYITSSVKNAAGYYSRPSMDPVDLFVGSEGTLAAIARIGIRLVPSVKILSGLTFFPGMDEAFKFADFLRKVTSVAAIEFFDKGSLMFIDRYRMRLPDSIPEFSRDAAAAIFWEYIEDEEGQFEEIMDGWEEVLIECGSSFEETWSGFDETEKERLHHFRHALPEMVNSVIAENKRIFPSIRKIGTDSAFPADRFYGCFGKMMELIKESGLTAAAFGHLGDYHIHVNLVPSGEEEYSAALDLYARLMTIAVENGGTVSAEHGIGKIKKRYLHQMYGTEGIAAMRAVKAALDPDGVFNPGNLF